MIGKNVQVNLDGVIFTAFNLHCLKKGYQNSAEAIRAFVRELPEYKQLTEGSLPAEEQNQANNLGPESQENS